MNSRRALVVMAVVLGGLALVVSIPSEPERGRASDAVHTAVDESHTAPAASLFGSAAKSRRPAAARRAAERRVALSAPRPWLERVHDLLRAGELDAAIELFRAETAGNPESRKQLERIVMQALIAREFAELELDAVTMQPAAGGKGSILLRGEVYEEGEYIQPDLFVKTVRREEVEYVYKGFTLVRAR